MAAGASRITTTMTEKTILFKGGPVEAIGRNGLTKAYGLVITEDSDTVRIHPWNTHRKPGMVGIPIPKTELQELITMLEQINQTNEQN